LSSRLLNGGEHMTTEHTVVRSGKSKGKPFNSKYSSGVGRLVELQVSGEDLALRLALRSVDAGRSSGRG
jgi:hypothetical protein